MASETKSAFESTSLYVGDLADGVTEAILFETFNTIGPVASIRVCRDTRSRRLLGYAYVNFHSNLDAQKALDTMNFQSIAGKPCRIMWSQRDPRLRQSGKGNIFVKNLHPSIDNKTLYDTFSVFGKILSCKVVYDKNTNKSMGYGYVHYIDEKSALEAIKGVNGMTISDKEVYAELFKSKKERLNEINKSGQFTNVYVKYIPKSLTEEMLINMFENETNGKITHYKYWSHKFGVCACLNFKTVDQAKKAVEIFQGREITEDYDDDDEDDDNNDGKSENNNKTKLYVARAQKRIERHIERLRIKKELKLGYTRNANANLYVKNLDLMMTDNDLKELFNPYGNVLSAKIMKNKNDNTSKGFGFVQFQNKDEAVRAKTELNSKIHLGKPLYVSTFQSKSYREKILLKQRNRQKNINVRYRQPPQILLPPIPQRVLYSYAQPQTQQQIRTLPSQLNRNNNNNNNQTPGNPMFMPIQNSVVNMPNSFGIGASHPNSQSLLQSQRNIHMNHHLSGVNINSSIPQQSSLIQSQPSQQNIMQQNNFNGQIPGPPGPSIPHTQQSINQQTQQPSSISQQQLLASVGQSSQQNASAPIIESNPLTTQMLQNAKPAERKRLIGERLFPKIQVVEPRLAGKITGMLLEMDDTELLVLLGDQQALMTKINEALAVLKDHQQKQSQSNVASTANSHSQTNKGSQSNQNI